MEVQIISSTAQKFNGETYYLCGNYFQRKGKRLHREVWTYHNGDIPKGYHVHHIDHNRSNNSIYNLNLIKGTEHLHQHMEEPERKAQSRKSIDIARKAANEWHGSEDGFKFHSALAKEYWRNAPMLKYVCDFCGKEFETRHVYGEGQHHFCHPNCKAKYRTRRLRCESEKRKASWES